MQKDIHTYMHACMHTYRCVYLHKCIYMNNKLNTITLLFNWISYNSHNRFPLC